MVIDIHTHAFPEAIAARTIEFLKDKMYRQSGICVENSTDGTVDGLIESMDRSGIDKSIIMPIATKISQTTTINNFAETLRTDKIISFGSVHPLDNDAQKVLEDLKSRGFLGIKLHPEFQDFYIDSPEAVNILKICERLGLFVLIHSGADLGYPAPYHCTPERLENTLMHISGDNLIAAHLGAFMMWDRILDKIVNMPIYIDTAAVGTCIKPDVYRDIIRSHGAERVLFGSDSPWEDQSHALNILNSTGIGENELELIKHKNAQRLFGI